MKGSKMKTSLEVERLLADPQPFTSAANEEFSGRVAQSSGWDPFEVWRTRIKPELDPKQGAVLA
jgi:hypothetical protein